MELQVSSGWGRLAGLLLVAAVSYVGVVAVLRLSGKCTLAKLNAFDFVVTIALGSTLLGDRVARPAEWSRDWQPWPRSSPCSSRSPGRRGDRAWSSER
jgi:hypothetical protein